MNYLILHGYRNFASNVGIKFYTPEEYFLKETPRPFKRTFLPADYVGDASSEAGMSQSSRGKQGHADQLPQLFCPILRRMIRISSYSAALQGQESHPSIGNIYSLLATVGSTRIS